MMQKIKEMLFKRMEPIEGQLDKDSNVNIPKNFQISFDLMLNDLKIGELKRLNDKWQFSYSEEFKSKPNLINPIIDFPLINKIYETDDLWPFFKIRIPNIEITSIKSIIAKEKLDKSNPAVLLKRFGKKSASNPFQLVPI